MPVRPRDLCCIFIVIFAEEKLKDRLDERGIQLDGDVDERKPRLLWLRDSF